MIITISSNFQCASCHLFEHAAFGEITGLF